MQLLIVCHQYGVMIDILAGGVSLMLALMCGCILTVRPKDSQTCISIMWGVCRAVVFSACHERLRRIVLGTHAVYLVDVCIWFFCSVCVIPCLCCLCHISFGISNRCRIGCYYHLVRGACVCIWCMHVLACVCVYVVAVK